MQTSMVFNQVKWPAAGDVDDCWVLSALQCVNVTAPWQFLYSVKSFRKAAGDPDDGVKDGGTLAEIIKGVTTLYPVYTGKLTKLAGNPWTDFTRMASSHRPLSVSVVSARLPARLQFGFKGYHQISVAVKDDGRWLVANPLAPVYSRWVQVVPEEIKAAIMAYGTAKGGKASVYAVAFPDDAVMAATYAAHTDTTPFDQDDVDRITAAVAAERDELAGRIDQAQDVLDGVE